MSLFLAGGKSLIDNTCPQNRAYSTRSISQAAPDRHKHPAENRTPPDTSIATAGVSICRAALGTDTVRYTVTQEQRQPASLRRGGHPLFSNAGVPAVQHSTMRSRGTHVTSVLTNRAVCFQILLETRVVKCCQAIHTSTFHFVPQLQML